MNKRDLASVPAAAHLLQMRREVNKRKRLMTGIVVCWFVCAALFIYALFK